jgi:methylmalonyl-CoA/ethylmalonyl-CoA epimerase
MSETNALGLEFHHLGLAVRRPDDAKLFLGGLGYTLGEPIYDPEQNANLILCRHHGRMPDIEIIYPAKGKSPVDKLINLRPDGLVYHLCYVTGDVETWLQRMEQADIRAVCMIPPVPAVLFAGRRVSFYNIVGVGLCEVIEDPAHTLV